MDKKNNDMLEYDPGFIASMAYRILLDEYEGRQYYPKLHALASMHSTDASQEKLLRRIEELLKKLDDS